MAYYSPYNPYMYNGVPNNNYLAPQMNRLNNLEQQYQQLGNGYMNTVPQPNILQGKAVDSVDVVNATDVPLDGTITYFPQTDGNVIYTKQLGMDGKRKVNIYRLEVPNNMPVQEKVIQNNEAFQKISEDINELKNGMMNLIDMVSSLSQVKIEQPAIKAKPNAKVGK